MEETTKYELRDLQSKDVFPMFKIISKIGIKEFKSCFESDEVKEMVANAKDGGEAAATNIGFSVLVDMAGIIISHISDAEKEIYSFLASLSGMKEKDIAELDMVVFAEMIVDVVKKEQFRDFIQVVSKLFK